MEEIAETYTEIIKVRTEHLVSKAQWAAIRDLIEEEILFAIQDGYNFKAKN